MLHAEVLPSVLCRLICKIHYARILLFGATDHTILSPVISVHKTMHVHIFLYASLLCENLRKILLIDLTVFDIVDLWPSV